MRKRTLLGGWCLSALVLAGVVWLSGCASPPSAETIQSDLLKVQQDVAMLAASATPLVQGATQVADIAEVATGNVALVPLTNAVSAAVQSANAVVAAKVASPAGVPAGH
jgi:hypothetical protein